MKTRAVLAALVFVLLSASYSYAQTFSSGSTGADGAITAASWNGNAQLTLQLPPSGVFNFTTVDVPAGHYLRFKRNPNNTPVVMLAQGNVVIDGYIDVSAVNELPNGSRTPGPGGFFGGLYNESGFGPGGGQASGPIYGRWIGPLTLVPIVGGSGGFGHNCDGAGGGGAIVIASSGTITINSSGAVYAIGGSTPHFSCQGYGSGGALRLVANAVTANGNLSAYGSAGPASAGVIRLEAPQGAITFNGSSSPAAVLSSINASITAPLPPSLTLVSIGGTAIPAGSGQRTDAADVLLPTQLPDPIALVVQGTNIPVGSQVSVQISRSPSATATTGTLAGTDPSSTASINITGLDRTQVIFIFASVTFNVSGVAPSANPAGPDQVAQLRVETVLGGKQSTLTFLRKDGTEIPLDRVPPKVRQHYGR